MTGGADRLPPALRREVAAIYRSASTDGDDDKTIKLIDKVLPDFPRRDAPRLWGQLNGLLGQLLTERKRSGRQGRKDVERAIIAYTAARDIHEPERTLEWTWAQKNLSIALFNRQTGKREDNDADAIAGLEACANRQGELGEVSECASSLVLLADVVRQRSPTADASERSMLLLTRVIGITWAIPTDPSMSAAIERLSNIETEMPDPRHKIEIRLALGSGFQALANTTSVDTGAVIDLAIAHWTEETTLRGQLGDTAGWADASSRLANLFRRRISGTKAHNLDDAISLLTRALPHLDRDGKYNRVAQAHCDLAQCLCDRPGLADAIAQAERELRQAAEALEHNADQDSRQVYAEAASYVALRKALDTGEHDDLISARDLCYKSLALTPRENALLWGEQQARLQAVHVALAMDGDTPPDDAIGASLAALDLFQLDAAPRQRRGVLQNLATLHAIRSEWQQAATTCAEAITASQQALSNMTEEASRLDEVREANALYQDWCLALLRLGEPDEAFRVLNRGWSRLNREWLLPEVYFTLDAEADASVFTLRQATRRLEAELRQDVEGTARADMNTRLAWGRNEWARMFSEAAAHEPSTSELTASLPAGDVVVVLAVTRVGSLVFVVPSGTEQVTSVNIVDLPGLTLATLRLHTRGTGEAPGWLMNRSMLSGYDGSDDWFDFRRRFEAQTVELLAMVTVELMQPVVDRIRELGVADDAELVVVPADDLGSVPLHAAVLADGTAVLDRYAVSYAPSLLSYRLSRLRAPSPEQPAQRVVAFVDPSDDLVGARDEADILGDLAEGQFVRIDGANASVDRVIAEAPGAGLVHFSCHGLHEFSTPHESGLVMSDHEILTIDWIRGFVDLRGCRLVVMSACDSGVTDFIRDPSESVGLPTAFVEAGAAGVLGTLWSVADSHASDLITRFYVLHLTHHLPPAQALRQVQRELRSHPDTAGPYAWGGFFMVGA